MPVQRPSDEPDTGKWSSGDSCAEGMTTDQFLEKVLELWQAAMERGESPTLDAIFRDDPQLESLLRENPQWRDIAEREIEEITLGGEAVNLVHQAMHPPVGEDAPQLAATASAGQSKPAGQPQGARGQPQGARGQPQGARGQPQGARGDVRLPTWNSAEELLSVGSVIRLEHQYVIQGIRSDGGQGAIYTAYSSDLKCSVAVKLFDVNPLSAESDGAIIAAQLNHPGVPFVVGAGETKEGVPLYVMRLIEGDDLSDRIRRTHQHGRKTPPFHQARRELLRFFVSACETLDYAHQQGAVHCDLKPLNIRVGDHGEVVLLDWDGAVSMKRRFRAPRQYRGIRTPGYTAPELERRPLPPPSPAPDIYSMGVVLYEILIGETPRRAQDPEFARLREAPGPLASIAKKAMDDDPCQRYHSASDLARDVRSWLEKRIVRAHRYSAWERLSGFLRQPTVASRLAVSAAVLCFLALVAAVAVQAVQKISLAKSELDGMRLSAQLTADSVAERFKDRWAFLEDLARQIKADPALLQELQVEAASAKALNQSRLQLWLKDHALHNKNAPQAESYFILNGEGVQIAKAVKDNSQLRTLGRSFAHRSYFQPYAAPTSEGPAGRGPAGRGPASEGPAGDAGRTQSHPTFHVSGVYQSSSTGQLRVAFCYAIWGETDNLAGELLGVICMSANLHGDIRFTPRWLPETEFVTIVDMKPCDKKLDGRRGAFLMHPSYEQAAQQGRPPEVVFEFASILAKYEELEQRRINQRLHAGDSTNGRLAELDNYDFDHQDPVDRLFYRTAFEPVIVEYRGETIRTHMVVKIHRR